MVGGNKWVESVVVCTTSIAGRGCWLILALVNIRFSTAKSVFYFCKTAAAGGVLPNSKICCKNAVLLVVC